MNVDFYDPNDPILLNDLTKRFGNHTAVDNLKISIKQGEIFTILGHNGAGKTTAINMLTGIHAPSDGDALVYGLSIRKDMSVIQLNIGLCQQFDVLFDELTVSEHLEFICNMKNMPVEERNSAIE